MKKLGYPNPDTLIIVGADIYNERNTGVNNPFQNWLKLQILFSKNSENTMRIIRENMNVLFEVGQEVRLLNGAIILYWFRGTLIYITYTVVDFWNYANLYLG